MSAKNIGFNVNIRLEREQENMLVGIDIGGTKICVCTGDAKGKIFSSERLHTKDFSGWQEGFVAIEKLVRELAGSSIEAIGISAPGPLSVKEGKMFKSPNLTGWENAPLVSYFKKAFQKPVCMNHDAKAAALAEYVFGASKGTPNLVYLTCSTGMGGGVIADGKLIQGVSDTATEVGHYILEIDGPPCPCGQRGCFEAFCGGAALAKKLQAESNLKDIPDLVEAVQKKDPYALKVWEEFTTRMAQGIGTVLMCFNPQVVILGTIAVHSGELLLKPVREKLARFAWKQNREACRIEVTALKDQISELSGLALAKSCA
jgi:glucokinase